MESKLKRNIWKILKNWTGRKALEKLETAFDMPYMGKDRCDDSTRRYLRENIKKAKEGDPSGFMESIQGNNMNCFFLNFYEAPATW